MPIKLLKLKNEKELRIERVMYTRRYSLILDNNRCVGCEICGITCPKEAIEIIKPTKIEREKLSRPSIIVDEQKCHFCGICSAICPYGALTLRIDGKESVPVLATESFPQIIHEIEVDESKCPIDCNKCEEACPFGLIKVSVDNARNVLKVNIDRAYCPGCRLCEAKCPYNLIHVRKSISGSIEINSEKCPINCHDCADGCPIPGILYVSEDGKVHVNDLFCVYCGACRIVCPVGDALRVRRTYVHHTPVHSGAWNKALEKLTSTKDMAKELRSRSIAKAKDSVKKRFS